MLTKFETKSNRVKGLAFHPKRPWILASLHSGVIQLWDYRMGTLIDRFAEHDGPVRGVEFHTSQPIFVSGGDDYKVKIWSYKARRCLFTLTGHLDYIRTVQFHPEHPWVVSASDDQTVRIWNWQSRTCMAVLTGHNHYVMCAGFHPKEDMVISASLDQTVRVWDISGLRKKSVAPGGDDNGMNGDLFGSGDAVVKYVLEGHERGVNWAAFHPTLPMIVSGADDRIVKLWRYNDSKAWVLDSLRGHMENVSCVIFNGRQQDLIISNSEDRTIRVWDMSRRSSLQTFRREHDRFWILATHPEINLLAAGHDSGMIVFKLARERPPHAVNGTDAYYIAGGVLKHVDLTTGRAHDIQSLPKPATPSPKAAVVRSISYNPAEHALLVNMDEEGGTFKLFRLPAASNGAAAGRGEVAPDHTGVAASAVFIARNRFAVWDRGTSQIQIRNLQNEITKRCPPPDATCSALFYAGTGMLLLRCEDKVILFDVQQRAAAAELQAPPVKYVVWNAGMTQVALLTKHAIILADAKLKSSCTVHETIRVKSAAWTAGGVLVYTTLNHLKFCLPGGDSGIVRTLDHPVYVIMVSSDVVHALDRDGKTVQIKIDPSEFMFKQALARRDFDAVLRIIRSGKLCGTSIIAFLRKKGFPEVALHFVEDDKTRFEIAIECGNIEVALETAQRLDDKAITHRLGLEAVRHGNLEIVEWCFQQTKAYERLSFLYALNGNNEKLAKMGKIADMRGNVMSAYQTSLLSGNVRARVKTLTAAGHTALAYVCAKTHGLHDEADALAEALGGKLPEVRADAAAMLPPTPILRHGNWPLLEVTASMFEGKLAGERRGGGLAAAAGGAAALDVGDADLAGGWGDYDLGLGGDGDADGAAEPRAGGDADDEDGGWDMEDLDLPADLPAATAASTSGPFVAPPPGQTIAQRWLQRSKLPVEHAAAGAFDSALRMLHLQLGFCAFEPLKPHMLAAHAAAFAHTSALPGVPPVAHGVDASWSKQAATAPPTHPATPFKLASLEKRLVEAYEAVSKNKLADALAAFTHILLSIPLLAVETRKEVDEVKELVAICREYHTGLRCELEHRATTGNPARAAELAAYFTHCALEPKHLVIALRSAMTVCYKAKLYVTCATFCRRLLELNLPEQAAAKARQVLAACEANPTDAFEVNYDPRNPFDLCAMTFVPIYRGSKSVACPYTGAKFVPDCAGKVSPLGDVAKIGADASGLVISYTQVR